MFTAVLVMHIGGAVLTGVTIIYAMYLLAGSDTRRMQGIFLVLSSLASFEVMSGVLLAMVSDSVTVASVCDNIAAYLALVGIIEAALYVALKRVGSTVPVATAISPIAGSFAFLAAGVLFGL